MCLTFGPVITAVVSVLKRVPFIARNPKWVALIISSVVGAYTATRGSAPGVDVAVLVQCVLTQFSASVATFEAVKSAPVALT